MSGSYAFELNAKLDDQIKWEMEAVFSPILRTGRVVIWPTWYASFARYDGLSERPSSELGVGWSERFRRWRRDMAAVLDYLASSAEFSDQIGWLGLSFGAAEPFMTAGFFAPPFKCAILLSGSPQIDQPWKVTLFRRTKLPALMLKGRYDQPLPIEQAQRFYELYGASPEDKRLVIYDAEHWPLPRNQVAREMSSWLDRYLGPVGAPVAPLGAHNTAGSVSAATDTANE
jgi:dienelactone hydrolase